jgi:hypothetical protein
VSASLPYSHPSLKRLGIVSSSIFQLFCSHPVVKTTWDRLSTPDSHPGHEDNLGSHPVVKTTWDRLSTPDSHLGHEDNLG